MKIKFISLAIFSLLLLIGAGCVAKNEDRQEGIGESSENPPVDLGFKASGEADFIEFDAQTITAGNLNNLADEYGEELLLMALDFERANILLSANNHQIDLSAFDYQSLAKLDGVVATDWRPLSDAAGGHHIAGVLTFPKDEEPGQLVITGLPPGEAVLVFK